MTLYLDHAATTAVWPQAARAALEAMTDGFANPSSRHGPGLEAARRLGAHRGTVAAALGCDPEEVCFTSGGTEGDGWAIRGALTLGKRRGAHIVTTAIEHAAVLEPMKALRQEGYEVTFLAPDRAGHIDPQAVADALRPDTVLLSMMLVNNELGTLLPVAQAARLVKERGCPALVHTDAVQAFLKVPFTPRALGVDLLTVSGHKVGAPKGIGALYLRRGLKLPPLLAGGGQERGLRPGTEPTAQIAAFAAACAAWGADALITKRILEVKNYAAETLAALPGAELVSAGDAPHILALSLPGYPSEMLVRALWDRGICVSSGSACHRGKPSHVFAALGLPKRTLMGVLRVSFGPENTRADVDRLAAALADIQSERIAVN